ncbi:hypothetical protein LZC95_37185 [Pendulispora brunnea]|uniref:Lipoprotein n=1 Tax=Pendulispora brunnea TaxID=2905690 RepID=A0ABZ2K4L9_9BACT
MKYISHLGRIVTLTALTISLPLVSAVACSGSDSDGVSVAVDLEAPSSTKQSMVSKTWTTDLGFTVTLQDAYLATGSVEIVPCASAAQRLRLKDFFAVREAHAHVEGSPTKLGIPVVESLLAAGGTRVHVGTMAPPPNSYCQVRYGIHAADGDAVGLPSDVSMVGKSLYLRGTYSRAGGQPVAFEASSSNALEVTASVGETTLSSGGTQSAVLVVRKVADTWFDGIAFDTASPDDIARTVLEHVRQSLTISAQTRQ